LNKAGAALFLESDQRLVTGHLKPLIRQALGGAGVVSWATHYATSSLTHPKMFDYFHTNAESFLFLPMVEATMLLFYNLPGVHNGLMLPWVQCALTQDCVLPVGKCCLNSSIVHMLSFISVVYLAAVKAC
jgi:hypothetical protein